MKNDEKLVKPLWYLNEKTLVEILRVVKNLDNDLKKKIITLIVIQKSEEDYYKYEVNYSYNLFQNKCLSDL